MAAVAMSAASGAVSPAALRSVHGAQKRPVTPLTGRFFCARGYQHMEKSGSPAAIEAAAKRADARARRGRENAAIEAAAKRADAAPGEG